MLLYSFEQCVIPFPRFNFLRKKLVLTFSFVSEQWLLQFLATVAVYGFVFYIVSIYYPLQFNLDWTVSSSIAFTRSEFDQFLKRAVAASFYVGGIALLWRSAQAFNACFKQKQLKTLLVTFVYVSITWFMFGISMVGLGFFCRGRRLGTIFISVSHRSRIRSCTNRRMGQSFLI